MESDFLSIWFEWLYTRAYHVWVDEVQGLNNNNTMRGERIGRHCKACWSDLWLCIEEVAPLSW